MIFTKYLLSQFVDISHLDINEVCVRLSSIGLEVESAYALSVPKKVVVGKILSYEHTQMRVSSMYVRLALAHRSFKSYVGQVMLRLNLMSLWRCKVRLSQMVRMAKCLFKKRLCVVWNLVECYALARSWDCQKLMKA